VAGFLSEVTSTVSIQLSHQDHDEVWSRVMPARLKQVLPVKAPRRPVGVPAEQGHTIVAALTSNARRLPDRPAMRHLPAERTTQGEWGVVTWAEYLLAARQIAGGLAEIGVNPGGRVAILAGNRWSGISRTSGPSATQA